MLRTWLRTIYSSFLDLSAWSEASSWYGRNLIKAQRMSAQFLSIIPLHTKSFADHNRLTLHSLQCSSTNPSSLSSPPSLWPVVSPPPQQGNKPLTPTQPKTMQTLSIQHRLALRPPVPPFAARAPRRAAPPSCLSPRYRLFSRMRSRLLTPTWTRILPLG
jgi:hypothetical protein